MLEYLRNASDKLVAKILIGLLAFSFVGWGVAEWIFGNVASDTALVRVGDEEVSMQDFNIEKARQLSNMTREQQKAIYTDSAAAKVFNDTILSNLTSQRMVENRAKDLGFVVTDARIAKEIRAFPEFQLNGEFSTYLFDSVLLNSGYTEASFAEVLRNQVLRAMMLGSLSVPMEVPDFAVKAVYNSRYANREIDYATVKFSDFKVAEPTEQQLKEFYAKNPKVLPEQRSVSYVLVSADMSKPDSYDEGYQKILAVEDEIIAGESLSAAANKNKAKYVNLGSFAKDKIPVDSILTDKLLNQIFAMEQGLESEIIETNKGFIIARVDKITPARNADFESEKKNLVSSWKKDEQRKQAYMKANEKLISLKETGKLADKKTATVSRTNGAPVDILAASFNNSIGEKSIVSGSDAFYVLDVKKEIAPKLDDKKLSNLKKELQDMTVYEIQEDYNSFLNREYPVEINEKVFNRFFAK